MNTTTKTEMLSYKSLKSRLRDNALKSAVGWAKESEWLMVNSNQ